MKTTLLLSLATVALTSAAMLAVGETAFAGPGTSGGGASMVCRDSKGAITSAALYELFEAQNDPTQNLTIVESAAAPEAQIQNVLGDWAKLKKEGTFKNDRIAGESQIATIQRALGLVKRDRVLMKAGTKIPLQSDIVPTILAKKAGCQLELTAYYDDKKLFNGHQGVLEIDGEIYGKLSNTHKAALLMHEAVYKMNRVLGNETTSENTRKLVAALFAKKNAAFTAYLANNLAKVRSIDDLTLDLYAPQFEAAPNLVGGELWMKQDANTPAVDLILGGKKLDCSGADGKHYFNVSKTENEEEAVFASSEDAKDWYAFGAGYFAAVAKDKHSSAGPAQLIMAHYDSDSYLVRFDLRSLTSAAAYMSGGKIAGHYVYENERDAGNVDEDVTCSLN
jgi:hypothetical protein